MGNCLSMFSEDVILKCDRFIQNHPFFNSGFNKEALKTICKGTYTGIRNNYRKFADEKVSLQTGKWWKYLFWNGVFSMLRAKYLNLFVSFHHNAWTQKAQELWHTSRCAPFYLPLIFILQKGRWVVRSSYDVANSTHARFFHQAHILFKIIPNTH